LTTDPASFPIEDEAALAARSAGDRLQILASSFKRFTGRELAQAGEGGLAAALWSAPLAVVAHGTEADPVFFYANRTALDLFEMRITDFIRMPSRLSAEPLLREARARLMERVTSAGFIDDYEGVRISRTGRRFRIERAIVWNLVDGAGGLHGQAAAFADWTRLD
jgi:hypothetical protein